MENETETTKTEKRGVVLIALGHANYGRMAYNLAVSLLNTSPDLKIHLVFNKSAIAHLNEAQIQVFSTMQEAPKESYFRKDNLEFIKAKTWMYRFTPFDTTIFLDVDMIWLTRKSIDGLFDELKELDYTCQNEHFMDLAGEINEKYSQWANVNEVKEKYGFDEGKYYSLHSEFIYFKKSKENKKFFEEWIRQYDKLKVQHTEFANGIPDELPLAIATIIHERYPHKTPFLPVFWLHREKPIERTELLDNYYGFSIGGNRITQFQIQTYNDFVQYYMNKIGSRFVFKAASKITFLPERQNY